MKAQIEKIKQAIRGMMFELAKLLDMLTNGFIRAWHVTALSLVGHVFVLLAFTEGLLVDGAILLAGFALLDALDGAIARYQGTESTAGMLLDASTDRLKEMLVFAGLAYYFAVQSEPVGVLYAVLALGFSFAVSYIKAKGEATLMRQTQSQKTRANINREFETGIFGYEVRMAVLVVALLASQPLLGCMLVVIGSVLTFMARFNDIVHRLR